MTISRRSFLYALGAGTVVTVAGCSGEPSGTGPSSTGGTATTTAPPSTSSAPSGPPNWKALRGKVSGGLLLPDDDGYQAASRAFNPLFDSHKPAAIAKCKKASDVQACLDAVRGRGVPIAARGGGHSYAGYSTPNDGLVIDMRGMSTVSVKGDQVEVGAGARLIDVYSGVANSGRLLPAGSCPSVGIAGLTLGGGIGVLSRKYGLTCDRLVSAKVVTPDGQLITASADEHSDLYWALRGGGGGNFGVVTSFTFSTEEAPEMSVFSLRFPAGSTADVVDAWQSWVKDAPHELWSNCVVSGGSTPTCRVGGCYVGSTSGLSSVLSGLTASASPSSRSSLGKSYLDAMKYMGGCSSKSVDQCHPAAEGGSLNRESFTASSRMLEEAVPGAKIVSAMRGHSGMDLLLDSLGGAVSDVDPSETAFPHRSALASAQIYMGGSAASAVGEVRSALGDLTGAHGYVNYIDPKMPDWGKAYYGDNLAKLKQVAQTYDPDGVLAFAQSVAKG